MISDRQLADAIEAIRVKVGAAHVAVGRSAYSASFDWWSVTFMDGAGAEQACVTEQSSTLAQAIDKAAVAFTEKRDEAKRRNGVALAYSSDWGAVT
jgi:hypothetical protein